MGFENVIGFEWDDGNWPKCGKHGVSRDEIEAAFMNEPSILPHPTHSTHEERLKLIGRTEEGRMVYVAFTIRTKPDGDYIRAISARYMHQKEIKNYER